MENKTYTHYVDSSKNIHYTLKRNEAINLNIIVIAKKSFKLNLKIDQYENSSCIINLSGLISNQQDSEIKIVSESIESFSYTEIKTFCLVNNHATLNVALNSIIHKHTLQNKVTQKIDGILMDDSARMTGQPNLKIDTDDIIATHALNIGYINPDELFYLKSKMLSHTEAINLILQSRLLSPLMYLEKKEKAVYTRKIMEELKRETFKESKTVFPMV